MTIKVTKNTPHGEELRAALQRAADRRDRRCMEDRQAEDIEAIFRNRKTYVVVERPSIDIVPKNNETVPSVSRTNNFLLGSAILMMASCCGTAIGSGSFGIWQILLLTISVLLGIAGGAM